LNGSTDWLVCSGAAIDIHFTFGNAITVRIQGNAIVSAMANIKAAYILAVSFKVECGNNMKLAAGA
jgi:hypothetical protein